MKILAIETSCDETSAAVVESSPTGGITVLSNVVASSMDLHAKTGGIIPEVAARNQITYIIPVIMEALQKANIPFYGKTPPAVDSLALTYGPGLIGSLLVGVETVKTLSYVWDKPLIPVNHLFGHIYANWITSSSLRANEHERGKLELPQFPLIALVVSGGHTDLVLMKSHTEITWLGGTRDDAAGEAYDKVGRLLGIPYPAGPKIEQLAKEGNPKTYHFPRPLLYDKAYDFSFSGLKTAVLREVEKLTIDKRGGTTGTPVRVPGLNEYEGSHRNGVRSDRTPINNFCRGVQDAIIEVLVTKTLRAAEEFGVKSILLSGGVAANGTLREAFKEMLHTKYHILNTQLFVPAKNLCTDNAAMIGAAAFFRQQETPWQDVAANPELYFD